MAQIIDGKQIANEIRNELKGKIDKWVQEGHRPPQLTAVLIGDDPASCTYVRNKMKVSTYSQRIVFHQNLEQYGVHYVTYTCDLQITSHESLVQSIQNNKTIKIKMSSLHVMEK